MTNKKSAILNESSYWWLQRLLSIILIPLFMWITILFMSFIINNPAGEVTFSQIIQYISLNSQKYIFILLAIVTFLHINLGVEEVIEDYVHTEKAKLAASILLKILIIRLVNEVYIFYIG